MPTHFLRLEELLLPPPLAAAMALLLTIGLADLGIAGARRLRGARFEPLDGAAGAVLAAALLAAAVNALALSGHLDLGELRTAAGFLALWGGAAVVRRQTLLGQAARGLWHRWRSWPALDRALALLLGVIAIGLVLAALGPACDADSIDYHLGVPLDWLRHGGAYPRPDWQHARLAGLGELLNLFGLAGGSDCFGALLQAEGLALAALAVGAFCQRDRDRLLTIALVLASPVMLSLVPAEKPQVLPAAATAVALVLLVRRWNTLDRTSLGLIFGCAAFAMACKYSFLLSGGVVVALGLWAARRARPGFAPLTAAAAILLLAAPIYLRNLSYYGDPVSPFLERLRSTPDPSLMTFATDLRDYGGQGGWRGLIQLIGRALAARPITGVLGLGVLSPLLTPWGDPRSRRLLGAAGAAAALDLALGQLTPRFFLEPFLWGVAALGLRDRPLPAVWLAAATFQASVVATGATICAALIFPGAWSQPERERVLTAVAPGYSESRWLDQLLRPDDVLLTSIRSNLFLPRPFVMDDAFDGSRSDALDRRALQALELDAGVSVLTVDSNDDLTDTLAAEARTGTLLGGPERFREVTRNPWLPQAAVDLTAIRLRR